MKRKRKSENSPEDPSRPLSLWAQALLESAKQLRLAIETDRQMIPPHMVYRPDYEGLERRLLEMERLARRDTAKDRRLALEIEADVTLDLQSDRAAMMAEMSERIVRFTDRLDRVMDEKKFEIPSESRDAMETVLAPYREGIREQMLGELPIETRRQLEEEKRRD